MTGIYSCSGKYLKIEGIADTKVEISGSYTVILYGGSHVNDKSTIAILVKEGTPYSFEVYKPEFDYEKIKGISGKDALDKAEKFVSFHHDFRKLQINRIVDSAGNAIAYEVRPLYHPDTADNSDVLDVDYKKTDGKVIVYIRRYEYPETEPMPFEGGGMFFSPK